MSEENVEIVRASFDAFNRTFTHGSDDFYQLLHPEIEWMGLPALVEGGSLRGIDAVRECVDDMRRTWETYELACADFHDLGNDRVLALGSRHVHGRRGGVELDLVEAAWLDRLRNGKIIRMQTFNTWDQARKAAGWSG